LMGNAPGITSQLVDQQDLTESEQLGMGRFVSSLPTPLLSFSCEEQAFLSEVESQEQVDGGP